MQVAEVETAMDRDADRIRNVLNTNDSDECPLKVSGHDLCSMTENLIHCIGKPLRKLNPEERKKKYHKSGTWWSKKKKPVEKWSNVDKSNCFLCEKRMSRKMLFIYVGVTWPPIQIDYNNAFQNFL